MESLKKNKRRRILVPKKKKKKSKMYFDQNVEDAIIRYNSLDPVENQLERNKIYQKEIHYAFDKLSENIINTFKFEYFDDVYEDVKIEVVSFLVMNIHKYDHTKGSKAFSYFSVVAKNYLILHNNKNYKKYKTHNDISVMKNIANKSDNETSFLKDFTNDLVIYFENNIHSMFKNEKDIDVAFAIIELFKKRDIIENFNKKSLYILIREMTDVDTSHITKVTNVFKKHYKKLLNKFDKEGTLSDNKNRFF